MANTLTRTIASLGYSRVFFTSCKITYIVQQARWAQTRCSRGMCSGLRPDGRIDVEYCTSNSICNTNHSHTRQRLPCISTSQRCIKSIGPHETPAQRNPQLPQLLPQLLRILTTYTTTQTDYRPKWYCAMSNINAILPHHRILPRRLGAGVPYDMLTSAIIFLGAGVPFTAPRPRSLRTRGRFSS